ncbi:VOC family protein [Cobetia sp. L2A1]|uniref:VOC family protein n=1 Tax=Cobetia sp. L2A1 TaxID=2686360 RepID=UPI00131D2E72|nr:VOC family protein [Cobetia sp. L2A1]
MQYLHTMLRITDLDASLHFFCDLLGFEEISRKDSEQGRFTLIFLAAPQDVERARDMQAPLLELTHNWDPEEYSGGRNFGHLAYRVENLYATCQFLMDNGVTINRPPRDGHMAFVKSPDGISLELLQQGDALEPQEPWTSMNNIGSW